MVAQRVGSVFTNRCARDLDQRQPWSTDDTSSLTCWLDCFNSENSEERFKIRDQHSHMSRAKLQRRAEKWAEKNSTAWAVPVYWTAAKEKRNNMTREFKSAKSTVEQDNGISSERSFFCLCLLFLIAGPLVKYYLHAPVPPPLDFWIGTHLCHQLCAPLIRTKPGSRLSRSLYCAELRSYFC